MTGLIFYTIKDGQSQIKPQARGQVRIHADKEAAR